MRLTPTALTRPLSLFLSSLALTLAAPAFSQAQSAATTTTTTISSSGTGSVNGTVLEPENGKYLVAADVAVLNTNIHTITGRGGEFYIQNVPAGAQSIVVSYPGQATKTIPVTVTAGQTLSLPVSLGSDVVKLETFTVESTKEGMAAAIAQQKN